MRTWTDILAAISCEPFSKANLSIFEELMYVYAFGLRGGNNAAHNNNISWYALHKERSNANQGPPIQQERGTYSFLLPYDFST